MKWKIWKKLKLTMHLNLHKIYLFEFFCLHHLDLLSLSFTCNVALNSLHCLPGFSTHEFSATSFIDFLYFPLHSDEELWLKHVINTYCLTAIFWTLYYCMVHYKFVLCVYYILLPLQLNIFTCVLHVSFWLYFALQNIFFENIFSFGTHTKYILIISTLKNSHFEQVYICICCTSLFLCTNCCVFSFGTQFKYNAIVLLPFVH